MVSRNASYREMDAAGLFSSEANCTQYLIDVGILAQKKRCTVCASYMMIRPCPETKYPEGSCWQCCNTFVALRNGSILQSRKLSYKQFVDVLSEFSRNSSVTAAAVSTGLSKKCVRSLFKEIRERIAEDIKTCDKIGGPGTIVEIDEAKFGKRKYNRGRLVDGSWVIGGVQRNSNKCFLAVCPQNRRNAVVLLPIIKQYVAPGTLIITDKWKAYVNLGNHGYIHEDVNHSTNFVDPQSGAHTNSIEGTWTHVKNHVLRRGGRRTVKSLDADLTLFMWLRQKGLLSSEDKTERLFCTELPILLNYKKF